MAAPAALLAGVRGVHEQEAARVRALGLVFEFLPDAAHARGTQGVVESAFRSLTVRQEPSRMQRIRHGFRLASHTLEIQILQYDQVIFGDEPMGHLLLEVVDNAMRLAVEAADLLLLPHIPVGTVSAAHILLRTQPGLTDTTRLRLLTTAILPIDFLQPVFRQVDERTIRQRETMRAATVDARLQTGALAGDGQRVVDEHEIPGLGMHADGRVGANLLGQANPDTNLEPASPAGQAVLLRVLAADDDHAMPSVELMEDGVRALVVPAHKHRIRLARLEPWHTARIPVALLQRLATLVRTPPVRVLDTVRRLQHHRRHRRQP